MRYSRVCFLINRQKKPLEIPPSLEPASLLQRKLESLVHLHKREGQKKPAETDEGKIRASLSREYHLGLKQNLTKLLVHYMWFWRKKLFFSLLNTMERDIQILITLFQASFLSAMKQTLCSYPEPWRTFWRRGSWVLWRWFPGFWPHWSTGWWTL